MVGSSLGTFRGREERVVDGEIRRGEPPGQRRDGFRLHHRLALRMVAECPVPSRVVRVISTSRSLVLAAR